MSSHFPSQYGNPSVLWDCPGGTPPDPRPNEARPEHPTAQAVDDLLEGAYAVQRSTSEASPKAWVDPAASENAQGSIDFVMTEDMYKVEAVLWKMFEKVWRLAASRGVEAGVAQTASVGPSNVDGACAVGRASGEEQRSCKPEVPCSIQGPSLDPSSDRGPNEAKADTEFFLVKTSVGPQVRVSRVVGGRGYISLMRIDPDGIGSKQIGTQLQPDEMRAIRDALDVLVDDHPRFDEVPPWGATAVCSDGQHIRCRSPMCDCACHPRNQRPRQATNNPPGTTRDRARLVIARARAAGDVLDFGFGLEAKIMAALDEWNHEGWLSALGTAAGVARGEGAIGEKVARCIDGIVEHCPKDDRRPDRDPPCGACVDRQGEIARLRIQAGNERDMRDQRDDAIAAYVKAQLSWQCINDYPKEPADVSDAFHVLMKLSEDLRRTTAEQRQTKEPKERPR